MTDTVDTVPHVHLIPIMRCRRLWVRGWCLGPGSPWFWSVVCCSDDSATTDKEKETARFCKEKIENIPQLIPMTHAQCPRQFVELIWRLCRVLSARLFFALFRRQQRGLWFVRVWSRKGGEWLMPRFRWSLLKKGTGQALNTGPMGGPCWLRFVSNAGTHAHPGP